jgi:16S rRNA (adenine1518-N6/adenine1519-N6)-dimethyltransferase
LTPAAVRALVSESGVVPSKRLGQNFVVDPGTVRRIVAAARLAPGEPVVEVGPGFGSLTLGLLDAGASVTAVEVDPRLARTLPGVVAGFLGALPGPASSAALRAAPASPAGAAPPRFTLLEADALKVEGLPGPEPQALVANLPYAVATKVLLRFLERFQSIRHGLVMVQAEVAARLAAPPGSRAYGVPSAKLAWWASAHQAGRIPRSAFFPVPHVDSELVYVERRDPPPCSVPRERVFALVDAAFSARRKTLRAALAAFAGGADRAGAALGAAGIDPSARGETLAVAEFARLAESLAALPVTAAGAAPARSKRGQVAF